MLTLAVARCATLAGLARERAKWRDCRGLEVLAILEALAPLAVLEVLASLAPLEGLAVLAVLAPLAPLEAPATGVDFVRQNRDFAGKFALGLAFDRRNVIQ